MAHDSELFPVHVSLYCTYSFLLVGKWSVSTRASFRCQRTPPSKPVILYLLVSHIHCLVGGQYREPYRSEVVATLSHDNIATRFDWTLIVLRPAQQKVSICRHCSTVQYAQGVPGRRNSSMAGPLSDRAWPKAENPE